MPRQLMLHASVEPLQGAAFTPRRTPQLYEDDCELMTLFSFLFFFIHDMIEAA